MAQLPQAAINMNPIAVGSGTSVFKGGAEVSKYRFDAYPAAKPRSPKL